MGDETENDATDAETSTSRMDFRLGLGVGGEHFFSPRFSLGGEVQLNRIWIGEEDEDPDPPVDFDNSGSLTATRAQFFIRWYFGDIEF